MTPVMSMAALADGEMALCRVNGAEVLVCNVSGQYYAVANRCSHAGQALHTGRLDGYALKCPLHRAAFDVRTGGSLGGPATEPIATYAVTLAGGKVNVTVT